MKPSALLLVLAPILVSSACGGGGNTTGARSLVGRWEPVPPGNTSMEFAGDGITGGVRVSSVVMGSFPPGCRDVIDWTGTYSADGSSLTISLDAGVLTQSGCDLPGNDMTMSVPGTSFVDHGSYTVTATTLTIELPAGQGTGMWMRATTLDAGMSIGDAGPLGPCAGLRPDISRIGENLGLAIDRDGTIYSTLTDGTIARIRAGGVEERWASGALGLTQPGLVLSADGATLFVTVPGLAAIESIATSATSTPITHPLVTTGGQPWALMLGPDGALYFTDATTGHVRRATTSGVLTSVSTSPVFTPDTSGSPSAGLAFAPDGSLFVADLAGGAIVRLVLSGNVESARSTFATGLGAPNGIAFDANGFVYVSDRDGGRLVRLAADGTGITELATGLPAPGDVEFGTGALDCQDVYLAGGAMSRYEAGTTSGAPVPWH